MKSFKCCKECKPPKRCPGCHDTCKEYQEIKALNENEKEKICKAKSLEIDYLDSHIAALEKTKRKFGVKRAKSKKNDY